MLDRAMQALFLLTLLPVAEEESFPHSYGFRPYRSVADAIEQCFKLLSHSYDPEWVLEGDIVGCFDNIDHYWLLRNVFIDRTMLQKWLTSGFIDGQSLQPTLAGTPQGGIISPTAAVIGPIGYNRGNGCFISLTRNSKRRIIIDTPFVLPADSHARYDDRGGATLLMLIHGFVIFRGLRVLQFQHWWRGHTGYREVRIWMHQTGWPLT